MAGFDGLSGSTGDDTVNASESRVLEGGVCTCASFRAVGAEEDMSLSGLFIVVMLDPERRGILFCDAAPSPHGKSLGVSPADFWS